MSMFTKWGRPDDTPFETALYADGTVLRRPDLSSVECQTPEFVRQVIASIEFPGNDYERLGWLIALSRANDRRAPLPAPSCKEDDHV